MTNEEIIKILDIIRRRYITLDKEEVLALNMAIKALEQEPIYYPPCQDCHTKMNEIRRAYDNMKSCEDAVSREEAIMCLTGINLPTDTDKLIALYHKRIKALPSVTPTRAHGEWIEHQDGRWIYAKCSKCETVHDAKSNFCPNCGADMRLNEVKNV